MKDLLKNYLLLDKLLLFTIILLSHRVKSQQVANYVSNGSFEDTVNIKNFLYLSKYWGATDTTKYYGLFFRFPTKVPVNPFGYQWPKHGHNYFGSSFYFINSVRGYPRNRLKQTLKAGKIYCVSMYVSLTHQSTHGIDAIGAFFGDSSLDTITQCTIPLTYLTPQVANPVNNVITDTMTWIPITGTFVANGTEKYMLIGNFKSDISTSTILTNTTNLPANAAEYYIDGVSCIEADASAYAGSDKTILAGDSVFVGRELDFAVDPYCVWYQLPNMTTSLDTISGLWVKPIVTSTYVVKQNLDCGSEKWDTVVVYVDYVGLEKLKVLSAQLQLYPVPANEYLELKFSDATLFRDFKTIRIYNQLSQLVREEELVFTNNVATISTSDFANGVYSLQLISDNSETVTKKLLIAK